jgi:hypothetical protein
MTPGRSLPSVEMTTKSFIASFAPSRPLRSTFVVKKNVRLKQNKVVAVDQLGFIHIPQRFFDFA